MQEVETEQKFVLGKGKVSSASWRKPDNRRGRKAESPRMTLLRVLHTKLQAKLGTTYKGRKSSEC
jgi:hypothetical protein